MENRQQRRWLFWAVVAAVAAVLIYDFSRHGGWRLFRWDQLWATLVHASPGWLVAAIFASYATYLVRAYRWKFFLDPIKPQASLWVLFVAQILGFSSIYLFGRPGEIVRPAYIARKEGVPFASQLAIWLLERVYDGLAISILAALALEFEPIQQNSGHGASTLRRMHEGGNAVLALTAILVAALVVFRLYSAVLTTRSSRVLQFLPEKFRSFLDRLVRSFSEGLDVIRNWRDLLASVGCTMLLWFLNASFFWLVFRSLGGRLATLTWWAAALALFFSALGLMVQLPGIGGGYQVGAILTLRQVYHVGAEVATGAGILVWVAMLVPCVAIGIALLIYEGLTFERLGAMAQEQRAAMTQVK